MFHPDHQLQAKVKKKCYLVFFGKQIIFPILKLVLLNLSNLNPYKCDSILPFDTKVTLIEGYLESFCKWQSKENPEYWNKLSNHPDHWDHGLMLTGLDLYDGTKKQTSVIGKFVIPFLPSIFNYSCLHKKRAWHFIYRISVYSIRGNQFNLEVKI